MCMHVCMHLCVCIIMYVCVCTCGYVQAVASPVLEENAEHFGDVFLDVAEAFVACGEFAKRPLSFLLCPSRHVATYT